MREISIGILFVLTVGMAVTTGDVTLPIVLPMQAVSVWDALNTLSNIFAPILGAIIAFVIWLHKRIEALEDHASQQRASLYGNKDDAMQYGVIREVKNIKDSVDNIKKNIDNKDDDD